MARVLGAHISTRSILITVVCFQVSLFLLLTSQHQIHDTDNKWMSFRASSAIFRMFGGDDSSDLPDIAADNSELILSSVLERSSRSNGLYITSFFLSKSVLDPLEHDKDLNVLGIASTAVERIRSIIKKQATLKYSANGTRYSDHSYFCKVKLDHQSKVPPVVIRGHFLPNRLTSDFRSNRKLDILRCPLGPIFEIVGANLTSNLLNNFIAPDKSILVSLFRDSTQLVTFKIPWKSRRTGYLMSSPQHGTNLEAWRGLDESGKNEDTDAIHLCVANTERRPLHHLVEFLEHHKQIGVQHVFFSMFFSWRSKSMQHVLKVVHEYVSDGFLTIQSSADTHSDPNLVVGATKGIFWNPHLVRVMQINSCLYLVKGMARYLGIWDLSDFFIPSKPSASLPEILFRYEKKSRYFKRALPQNDSVGATINRQQGKRSHLSTYRRSCFIASHSRNVYPNSVTDDASRQDYLWLSSSYDTEEVLFSMNRKVSVKYIIPTEVIFQGGLHMPGGCRTMQNKFACENSCLGELSFREGLCAHNISGAEYVKKQMRRNLSENKIQAFDDIVDSNCGHFLDISSEGLLYTFNNVAYPSQSEQDVRMIFYKSDNVYGKLYSDRVDKVLNAKEFSRLNLFLSLYKDIPPPRMLFSKWKIVDGNHYDSLFEVDYHLSKRPNFSAMTNMHPLEVSLPSFTRDFSDVLLGSIIERSHDSFQLYVTSFFIQHELLYAPPKGYGFIKIRDDEDTKQSWRRAILAFNDTQYSRTGQRSTSPRYFCHINIKMEIIANDSSSIIRNVIRSYSVHGEFMPNALTVDQNANRRVDILRCPMKESEKLFQAKLPESSEYLEVAIYREKTFLISFNVPWKTRRTGFSLSSPSRASKFDAWQNSPLALPKNKTSKTRSTTTTLHMCVPGFESVISQRSLTVYAEFLQHHFLQGVQHMFVAAPYAWNGVNMANFLTVFQGFINEGVMSVSSLTESENEEYLYAILGATLDRDNVKVIQVSTCLYLSKGVADYVAVWDNDEFFVPRPPHHSILDVIRSVESPTPLQYSSITLALENGSNVRHVDSRGWADGDDHPFCFLHFKSEVFFTKTPSDFDYFSPNRDIKLLSRRPVSDFVGDHFNHMPEPRRKGLAFQKSILPTRLIFQAGLHVGAACHLPLEWTHCSRRRTANSSSSIIENKFCYSLNARERYGYELSAEREMVNSSPLHNFDTLVQNKDARLIPMSEASLYHIQIHRYDIGASVEAYSKNKINDYSRLYFPDVIKELKRRNIYEILTTRNFQSFFENGNEWGLFLAEPDSTVSSTYLSNHILLTTLSPALGSGWLTAQDEAWTDFAEFYANQSASMNDTTTYI